MSERYKVWIEPPCILEMFECAPVSISERAHTDGPMGSAAIGGTIWVETIRQLLSDLAERDVRIAEYRDEFGGLCHTLSVGSEGRPEMTASDWRKRVDQGIEFLIRPLQERAERAEAELARLRGQEPVAWMWNDELGCPHASAGSKKPVWLESSASAEYIRQANLRPLYAEPMPAKELK